MGENKLLGCPFNCLVYRYNLVIATGGRSVRLLKPSINKKHSAQLEEVFIMKYLKVIRLALEVFIVRASKRSKTAMALLTLKMLSF